MPTIEESDDTTAKAKGVVDRYYLNYLKFCRKEAEQKTLESIAVLDVTK